MKNLLFTKALRLPEFRGKWRLVSALRSSMAPYLCRTDYGFEMELDCFEWAQLHVAQHGNQEPSTMQLISKLLGPGDTCVDVGAHVGFVSLVARQAVGESGRVVAVEPQPYNCERLLRNWDINGFSNLELYVAAAGDEIGSISLPQQSVTDKSRLSLTLPMPDATSLKFHVPIRTLESIFFELGLQSIKLLKVDVEGYELEVLKGTRNCITNIENIVFEALHDSESERQRSEHVCDWLSQFGYELRTVNGSSWQPGGEIVEGNLWATQRGI